ncbi:MAG: cold shock domain-containing protein [Bdellovibrio sp.]|nr:MAG: cold shock domain-containing protein [Bdellovibrio sp.]
MKKKIKEGIMNSGKVIWYNELEGYGFIEQHDGKQIYFHYTAISKEEFTKNIKAGSKVYYDILDTSRGLEATNIKFIERAA